AGDGGIHSPGGVWWLSPDIKLTGATSGADQADPGASNTVEVFAHMKSGDCKTRASESVTVEVWAANPSLVMTPDNPASAVKVGGLGMPTPAPGTAASVQFGWTPPSGLPPEDPQGRGHKCLIARCYPEALVPSAEEFFVPDDQHVAQRNICVVPCGAPGAARVPGPCGQEVTTVNPRNERQSVTLRAEFDAKPSKHTSAVVLERLRRTEGFVRLAEEPPQSFRITLRAFPKAEFSRGARGGCLGQLLGFKAQPGFDAYITLEPKQLIRFDFNADLTGSPLGDAYIFHLTQVGTDGRTQGGLTVVMLAV
ncbi:MAG TPA: hypothetical protein VFX96_16490, partial [Pyrinomonadaceae bacterium]|nr:hypothetical protein [Pyrinomonadaceae bacterium]